MKVLCVDGGVYHIYRRYRQFDEMEKSLEKRFPIEAGAIRVTDRTLPRLPSESATTPSGSSSSLLSHDVLTSTRICEVSGGEALRDRSLVMV